MHVRTQQDILVDITQFRVIKIVDCYKLPENIRSHVLPVLTRYQLIVTDSTKSEFELMQGEYIFLGGYRDIKIAQLLLDVLQYLLFDEADIDLAIMPPEHVEYEAIKSWYVTYKQRYCSIDHRKSNTEYSEENDAYVNQKSK